MKKAQTMVVVADLTHAPWNPRAEAELDAGHPEMVKLISSVREIGVIQPIAVWASESGEYTLTASDGSKYTQISGGLVIAGNRRFAAAVAVGMDEIPAIVFSGISEVQAREITRVENEVRIGIDPLRDSELIGSMLSLGYEQKEIAAHFGVSEATICRRAKLLGLVPEIREIVSGRITTEALEQIALYPDATQRECIAEVKKAAAKSDATLRWSDVRWMFDRKTKDLDSAEFDTSCCRGCAMRTGAQPDLWNNVPADGKLGSCLVCECYEKKFRDHLADLVRKEVGEDVVLVDGDESGEYSYIIRNRPEFSDRRSKTRDVAWWYWMPWRKEFEIIWGPSLEDWRAIVKAEREAAAAEAEKRAAESEAEKAARAEREAELRRIEEERLALQTAVDNASRAVADRGADMDRARLEKIARSAIFAGAFKRAEASVLAETVASVYSYVYRDEECRIRLIEAFPKFAKALKVKPEELKAYRDAVKALDEFNAEHDKD